MARSVDKYRRNAPNIRKSSRCAPAAARELQSPPGLSVRSCYAAKKAPKGPLLQRRDNTRSPVENRPFQGPIFSPLHMALTPQDIARIAHLARLELKPEEAARMLTQINGFFDIVEKMK